MQSSFPLKILPQAVILIGKITYFWKPRRKQKKTYYIDPMITTLQSFGKHNNTCHIFPFHFTDLRVHSKRNTCKNKCKSDCTFRHSYVLPSSKIADENFQQEVRQWQPLLLDGQSHYFCNTAETATPLRLELTTSYKLTMSFAKFHLLDFIFLERMPWILLHISLCTNLLCTLHALQITSWGQFGGDGERMALEHICILMGTVINWCLSPHP